MIDVNKLLSYLSKWCNCIGKKTKIWQADVIIWQFGSVIWQVGMKVALLFWQVNLNILRIGPIIWQDNVKIWQFDFINWQGYSISDKSTWMFCKLPNH